VETEPVLLMTSPPATAKDCHGAPGVGRHISVPDYWALTKPEVNLLIVITAFAGFCLGRPTSSHPFPFLLLIHTMLGTLMVAGGTGTLNQYIERSFDAKMRRTARRPLAAGRIEPSTALWFGILLSCVGGVYLAVAVNTLASLLAVLTLVSYLFLYTPLKRKTPLCTLVGAFPGAMPPLIGWAAASGRLSLEAWVLYAMLFLWQFPHFMAIAWMYREDYARAGYLVLPLGERRGSFAAWQSLVPPLALLPVSLVPTILGHAGSIYLMGALLLSSTFLYFGARLALGRSNAIARRLLFASIVYLPLVFVLMVLDKA
jgi:protoheme IX farnesyltransferase